MSNEYVVVNKTAIEKRIEELKERQKEFLSNHPDDVSNYDSLGNDIEILEQILSQSTPLIDEIEKAFDEGFNSEEEVYKGNPTGKIIGKKEYLSNLKLDI